MLERSLYDATRLDAYPSRGRARRQTIDEGLAEYHARVGEERSQSLFEELMDASWNQIRERLPQLVDVFQQNGHETAQHMFEELCWRYLDEVEEQDEVAEEVLMNFGVLLNVKGVGFFDSVLDLMVADATANPMDLNPGKILWLQKTFAVDIEKKQERRKAVEELCDKWTRYQLERAGTFVSKGGYDEDEFVDASVPDPLALVGHLWLKKDQVFPAQRFLHELHEAIGVALARGDLTQADALIDFSFPKEEGIHPGLKEYQKIYARHRDEIQQGYLSILESSAVLYARRERRRSRTEYSDGEDVWESPYSEANIRRVAHRLGMQPDWKDANMRAQLFLVLKQLTGRGEFEDMQRLSVLSGMELPKKELQEYYCKLIESYRFTEIEQAEKSSGIPLRVDTRFHESVSLLMSKLFDPRHFFGEECGEILHAIQMRAPQEVTMERLEHFFQRNVSAYDPQKMAEVLQALAFINLDLSWLSAHQEEINEQLTVAALNDDQKTVQCLRDFGGEIWQNAKIEAETERMLTESLKNFTYEKFAADYARVRELGLLSVSVEGALAEVVRVQYARTSVDDDDDGYETPMTSGLLRACLLVGLEPTAKQKKKFAYDLRQEIRADLNAAVNGRYQQPFRLQEVADFNDVFMRLKEDPYWKDVSDLLQENVQNTLSNSTSSHLFDDIFAMEQLTGIQFVFDKYFLQCQIRQAIEAEDKQEQLKRIENILQSKIWGRFKDEVQSEIYRVLVSETEFSLPGELGALRELMDRTGWSANQLIGRQVQRHLSEMITMNEENAAIMAYADAFKPVALFLSPTDSAFADARRQRAEMQFEKKINGSSGAVRAAPLDPLCPSLSQQREQELFFEIMRKTDAGGIYGCLLRAKEWGVAPPWDSKPFRDMIKENVLSGFRNGVFSPILFKSELFDKSLLREIPDLNRVVQPVFAGHGVQEWGDICKTLLLPNSIHVMPDLNVASVHRRWTKDILTLLRHGDLQLVLNFFLYKSPDQPGLQLTDFSEKDFDTLLRAGNADALERLIGKSVTDEEVFAMILKHGKTQETFATLYKKLQPALSENQRLRLKEAWQTLVVHELRSDPTNVSLNKFKVLTGDDPRWEFTDAQQDEIRKSYRLLYESEKWFKRHELTGVGPDMRDENVKKCWENIFCSFSIADGGGGRQEDAYWTNRVAGWKSWGETFGMEGTFMPSDENKRTLITRAVDSLEYMDKPFTQGEALEALCGVSFSDIGRQLMQRWMRPGLHRCSDKKGHIFMLEQWFKQHNDQASLAEIERVKQHFVDCSLRDNDFKALAELMDDFDKKPQSTELKRAILGYYKSYRSSSLEDRLQMMRAVFQRMGNDFDFQEEDIKSLPKDKWVGAVSWLYENFMKV